MYREFDVRSDAWKVLSEDERYKIVKAVTARFARRFGNLAEINYFWPCFDHILVGTALPAGTSIASLPASFEGIPVKQDPLRESMDAFIATWSTILERIGGWSPDRIAAFANDRHPHFHSIWFLHDSPIQWVAGKLLPDSLPAVDGLKNSIRIEDEIVAGVRAGGNCCHPDLESDYDWDAARDRVNAAIQEMKRSHVNS